MGCTGGLGETKPISGGEQLGAGCTNKANSGFRPNPCPTMPNKPNLPGGAGAVGRRMLYKQSQFSPEQKEGQRLGGKGVMVNSTFDRPQQNKAN